MEIIEGLLGGLFTIVGGISLILLGLRFVSEALQVLGAGILKKCVEELGRNKARVFWSGVISGVVLQSSVSASMIATSFAATGLLGVDTLLFFQLGAQLVTALTPWLFVVHVGKLDLYFLALGALPMLYSSRVWFAQLGRLAVGVGMAFLGYRLGVMSGDLLEWQILLAWVSQNLGSMVPFFAALLGLAAVCVIRSSIAFVVIVLLLTEVQMIGTPTAVAILIGMNVGATLPPLWTSFSIHKNCRVSAWTLLAVNVVVGSLLLFFEPSFLGMIDNLLVKLSVHDSALRGLFAVPAAQSLYLILIYAFAIAAGPFLRTRISQLLGRDGEKVPQSLSYHGPRVYLPPALGLELIRQELQKMAAMVQTMLEISSRFPAQADEGDTARLIKYESITDNIHREVVEFASQLMGSFLTTSQSREIFRSYRMAHELEGIADACKAIQLQCKGVGQVSPAVRERWWKLLQPIIDGNQALFESYWAEFMGEVPSTVIATEDEDHFMAGEPGWVQRLAELNLDLHSRGDIDISALVSVECLQKALFKIRHHSYNLRAWQKY